MSKKAIVFYSYGNNTKKIVDEILKVVKADVYEIKPVNPFPEDYQTLVDMEENKQGQDELIEITDSNIKLKEYDTIILGTPVWWYTMASPIRSFLKKNDFTGKTIIPFITNGGFIGTTLEDIKKYTPGATVKNEIDIKFNGNNLETSLVGVTDWIDSI